MTDELQKAASGVGIRIPVKEEENGVRAILDEIDGREAPSPSQRIATTIAAIKEIWGCDASYSEAQEFREGATLRKILNNRLTLYGDITREHVATYGNRKYKAAPRNKTSTNKKPIGFEAAWRAYEAKQKARGEKTGHAQPDTRGIEAALEQVRDEIRLSNKLQVFRAQPFLHDLGARLGALFWG